MESQAAVAKRATSLYIANIVVLVANTLYFLVLTNVLKSTRDVGVVTALNLAIIFLVTICILAQPVTVQSPIPAPLAVLRFIPEFIAKSGRKRATKAFTFSLVLTLALSTAVAAALWASPALVAPLLGGEAVLPDFIRISAVDVVALSLAQVSLGALIATGDLKAASAAMVFWSVVRYGMASLLLIQLQIFGVFLGFVIGDLMLFALAFVKAVGSLRSVILNSVSENPMVSFAELSRYSIYTLASAVMGYAVSQADKVFTLAQQGLQELAVYNVAIVASTFAGFAPSALLTVLLPALAALRAAEKISEAKKMILAYTRYVSIVVIPIAVGFASITEIALRIFGTQYLAGLWPTVIVSVATGVTAVGSVYAGALLAFGELKWYVAANILGLAALVAISAILTPFVGLNGPALGRAALLAVTALVYAIATYRNQFFEFDLKSYATATGASVVMGVVVFLAVAQVQSFLTKFVLLPVFVLLGAAIYAGLLRFSRLLTASDVEFVASLVPARFRWLVLKLGGLVGIETRA